MPEDGNNDLAATMPSFDTLELRPELLTGVQRLGYAQMTDIQAATLPMALEGRDIAGRARTGSGKTAAFGLAILQRIDVSDRAPQALILCPTRELAGQLTAALRALAVGLGGTRILTVTGGAPSRAQRDALVAGVHVIVATPGRILQHLELGRLKLDKLRCLVMDEADRILDMGFEEQVSGILRHATTEHQTLLFSATWPKGMAELSARIQQKPLVVGMQQLVDAEVLRQRAVHCSPGTRDKALLDVLAAHEPIATLIFCETRRQCKSVVSLLKKHGADPLALHGDLEQRDREQVLVQLRNESTRILVATNVAARGLDLDGLGLVICYELSPDPENHINRIGRTARAEAKGQAISLVAGDRERGRLAAIENHMGAKIPLAKQPSAASDSLAAWAADYRTLAIAGGRKDKLRAGDILGALTRDVGIVGTDIGKIILTEHHGWVAVRNESIEKAVKGLNATRIKKRRFRVFLVD